VTVKRGEVVLIDRGSTNGTYVNQIKVENATLKSGDIIQLGRKCNTTLVFNL
jgi:pSer/pThr/pTyr-binding forkhead associated (FHA) protein